MSTVSKKIMMGSGAGASDPVDDDFNSVAFLSHFDGANNGVNNAFDDSSATDHTISVLNSVTQGSFGPYSPAYGIQAVNGVTQNRKFALSTVANAYGAWTVEWWFKADAASVSWQQMITEWDNGTVSQQCWEVFVSGGFIRTYVRDSGSNSYSSDLSGVSAAAVTSSKWHYLSVADDGSNFRVHLDGALIQKDSRVPQSGSTGRFMIGFDQATTTFAGTLADVKVSDVSRYTDSTYSVPTAVGGLVDSDTLLLVGGNNARDLRGNYAASIPAAYPVVPTAQVGRVEAYDPAVNGASAFFNGGNNNLSAPDSADFTLGTTFTIEAWVYPTTLNAYNILVEQNNGYGFYYCILANGKMEFYQGIGGASYNNSDAALVKNQWNHVAYVVSSGTAYHYVNGARSGSSVSINIGDIGAKLQVGQQSGSSPFPYTGYMSDVRILKGTALYSGTTYTIPTAPLTAITNTKLLLNMANAQALDSAAFNSLQLVNGTKTSTTQKKFGDSSAYFDGTNSHDAIWTPPLQNPALVLGGDFTIEGWMWCASGGGGPYGQITLAGSRGYYESGTGLNWQISRYKTYNATYQHTPNIEFASYNGDGSGIYASFGTGTLTDDAWNHYAVVRTNGVLNVYYNGARKTIISGTAGVGTVNLPLTRVLNDSYNLGISIGAAYQNSTVTNELTGYIDDFRISNIARYSGSSFDVPTEPFPDKGQES